MLTKTRVLTGTALLLLVLSMLLAGPALTQQDCTRVYIYFAAAQDSVLDGKLVVGYEQTGGGAFGFADFWMEDEPAAAGEEIRVGAFNIVGVDDYRLFFNDDELDIDGEGDFITRTADCTGALPADDGRLNTTDPASLAVVYANRSTNGFDVYLIDPATGSGALVIRASRAEVEAARQAATAPGGVNTLVAASGPVSLWALTSGECQRNAFYPDGSLDEFIFVCG